MERGLRDPRLSTLVRLAEALEVEPGHLLANATDSPGPSKSPVGVACGDSLRWANHAS